MKIRSDFVTNSSSSSYIISLLPDNDTNKDLVKQFVIVWLEKITENGYDCSPLTKIEKISDVTNYFYDNEEELISKVVEEIKDNPVYYFQICHHDLGTIDFLNELQKRNIIKILYKSGD